MSNERSALRRDIALLLAITFAFPVVLALLFFPTPAIDLREHINWGPLFPLQTWKHPPLQSWLAGLVALTSLHDAWPYVLLAQVLNGIALYYLVRITAEFIDRDSAAAIAIAFCGTLTTSATVLTGALNADHIQAPLWLGMLYHALRGVRDDRWRDWCACGLLAGLAILTKYFAAIFILALGLVLLLQRPALVRRPGPYLSAALGLAVAAINVVPELLHPSALDYAADTLGDAPRLSQRLHFAGNLVVSFISYPAPLLAALAWLWWRGGLARVQVARDSAAWSIVATFAFLVILLLTLILFGGSRYLARFSTPAVPLFLLVLFCAIRLKPDAVVVFARFTLAVWCGILVGALAYAAIFINSILREPADAAAAAIRADWQRQFRCGPAYIVGPKRAAHALGVYYGGETIGVSPEDYRYASWIDRRRLFERGAVLVNWSDGLLSMIPADVPAAAGAETILQLPYRRTWRDRLHTYRYRFIPPRAC